MEKRVLKFFVPVFFVLALLCGCKNNLIPYPELDKIFNPDNINEAIKAPTDVKASHGGYKNITLSWTGAANAVRYKIYGAANPFEEAELVGETRDDVNSYSLDVGSGEIRYYKVTSVDYNEKESPFSKIVKGSTMATPSITSIESNTDGTEVSVSWWMVNCESSTYADSAIYKVRCFDEEGKTVVAENICRGNVSSYTFTNLSPKTIYLYDVGAYIESNASDEKKYEWSDRLDSETARKLIPDAPVNFEATQGTKAKVELSWELPNFVDTKASGNSYNSNPLYFTVERKVKDSTDEWTVIENYIGTCQSSYDKKGGILIDCENLSYSSLDDKKIVRLEKSETENPDVSETYPAYIPGTKIYYTDSAAESGVQYSYRITSFTDDVDKTVSSEDSRSVYDGWNVSTPSFAANVSYEKEDETSTLHSLVSVDFDFSFETFGQNEKYGFVVTSSRTPFATETDPAPAAETEVQIGYFDSSDGVNSSKKDYSFGEDNSLIEGYYKYKVYVVSAGNNSIPQSENEYYAFVESLGSVTVVQDSEKLPSVTGFVIEDGYKDKFVVKWDYNENYEYVLKWIPYENDVAGAEESLALPKEELSANVVDGIVTYNHDALSGDVRQYILEVNAGFKTEKTYDSKSYTLGTADLSFEKTNYDKIVVKWPKVQNAKTEVSNFAVEAYYEDDETKTPVVDFASGTNGQVTFDEASGLYSCELNKPSGFDDSLKAGKSILFNVTSQSSTTSDSTVAQISTCVLGPALLNTSVGNPSSEMISVKWNEIKGAKGYIIRRGLYTDAKASSIERSDSYYLDAESLTLTVNGEKVDESRAKVTKQTVEGVTSYLLSDKYAAVSDETSSYEINQSRIAWGKPFGYVLIPVLQEEDFVFGDGFVLDSSLSAVDYCTKVDSDGVSSTVALSDVKGACFGYGLNLKAQKAEQSSSQKIEWELPYISLTDGFVHKTPSLYRREIYILDSTEIFGAWERVSSASLSSDSTSVAYNPADSEKIKTYEYAVDYNSAGAFKTEFVEYCKEQKETRYAYKDETKTESSFRGYLLYTGYEAAFSGGTDSTKDDYYSERVTIDDWNYNLRALGPDSFTVSIKNSNIGSEWIPAVTFAEDKTATAETTLFDTTVLPTDGQFEARFYPTSIAEGSAFSTEGTLKVLRDARHYYKITLNREDYSADVDNGSFAYRQITAEELVRSATLAMAVGLHKAVNNQGIAWTGGQSGSSTESSPGSGSTSISTSGGFVTEVVSNVTYTNYLPIVKNNETFLTVSGKIKGNTGSNFATSCPNKWTSDGSITITGPSYLGDDIGLYSGTFTLNGVESSSIDKIVVNNQNVNKTVSAVGNCALPFDSTWRDDSAEWQ